MPEEQVRLQKDYIRVVLLMADIDRTGRLFSDAVECNRWDEALQELKNGFIAYALLGQSRANLCRYGKSCGAVAQLARGLAQRLDFLGHLRNLISGHLDDRLLEKVIHWEPQIFYKEFLENPESYVLVFKSLLEAGIDCCIAEYPQDKKLFSGEIDLAYPPDLREFMEFMHETFRLSVKFLLAVKEIIFQKLKPYDPQWEIFERTVVAGETDFRRDTDWNGNVKSARQ